MTKGAGRSASVLLAWVALGAAALARPAVGQVSDFFVDGDGAITVDADSLTYEQAEDVISARGSVEIRRGETVLRADHVRLNRRTSEAEAIGDAVLTTPDDVIRADEMHLNMQDETGWMKDAEIHSSSLGYSLWGERVEKSIGQHYRIENGRFTTCQCPDEEPEWSIAGEQFDVAMEGYGDLRGGSFDILGVPVLPIFRAKFPVHRDRQSGLLLPRVGASNRRGFQLVQPYYWAINRSHDATVTMDVETSARLGLMAEYRYALSETTQGQIDAAYFNEAIRTNADSANTSRRSNITPPTNRWGASAFHTQRIGTVEAYADVLAVGDDLFLREMNVFTADATADRALRTLPFTTSRAGFLQNWSRVALQGEAIAYQDLIGRPSLALQRVPEIRLDAQKMLGFDLVGRLDSSLTDFQRGTGITGVRADILPGVQLKLPLGPSVFGTVQANVRETAYVLTQNEMECGLSGEDCVGLNGTLASEEIGFDVDRNPVRVSNTNTRELFELRGDLSTAATRVFDFPHFGIQKLKHTIEPRLQYLFVPGVSQGDLPVFDTVDRINQRNLVLYGVASRLLARGATNPEGDGAEVSELLRFSILQGFDAARKIRGVSPSISADHFSDIDLGLRVNPSRLTSVRLRSSIDTGDGDFSFASVGIRLRDPFGTTPDGEDGKRLLTRTTFDIDYRFVRNNGTDPELLSSVQLLDAGLMIRLTDRLGALYATRYDIQSNSFLENHFGIRIVSACDCWSLDIGVTDKSNPDEIAVRAQLTLAGLASLGTGNPFGTNN